MASLAFLAGMAFFPQPGRTCDTPVYRYAMYNWLPSIYAVCYLHRGTPAAEEEPVHRVIRDLEAGTERSVNIHLELVDLSQEDPNIPRHLWESWAKLAPVDLPRHVVLTPRGQVLYEGRLDLEAVSTLVDSPARQQIGRLLEEGKQGVFVFLPGANADQNARARSSIRDVIQKAAGGIRIPGDARNPVNPQSVPLGLVALEPGDREEWLARMLRGVEELEPGDEGQPMVFAVYGRGRADWPYIGAGITAENLIERIAFLNGSCSCEVKEMNPGMDLLTAWNWESTAAQLALASGEETGNERFLEMALLGARGTRLPPLPSARTAPSEPAPAAASPGEPATASPAPSPATIGTSGGERSNASVPAPPAIQFRSRLFSNLAIGGGVGVVLVIALGCLLLRRRKQ